MKGHPGVPHPYREIKKVSDTFHDRFLSWVTDHVLPSTVMFDAALVLPLLALPAPSSIKLVLGVLSSNWIQWWALPALQKSAVRADLKRDAKADADHQAMTHMATALDRVEAMVVDLHTTTLGKEKSE